MNAASGFSDPLVTDTPLPFHELCARIHERIGAFLDAKDVSDRVKNVQEQTRISLQVIAKALELYRFVTAMWGNMWKLMKLTPR
jgi:FAD synthetase